jgi:predicted enzyme related to lactoylglutathione lyase
LRTTDLPAACSFYTELFGWRAASVRAAAASYLTLDLGSGVAGGVVEVETGPAAWIPYVEVTDVAELTERARLLGAAVPVEPREGPAGWRSVLTVPAGGEIALWQPKL